MRYILWKYISSFLSLFTLLIGCNTVVIVFQIKVSTPTPATTRFESSEHPVEDLNISAFNAKQK